MILATVLDGRHFLTLWVVAGVILTLWTVHRGRL